MSHKTFIYEQYSFDKETGVAVFEYSFDHERWFRESVVFDASSNHDQVVLAKALRLAFLIAGISYYKCFPTQKIEFSGGLLTSNDVDFLNFVYREGLSQFVYENGLNPEHLAQLYSDVPAEGPSVYGGEGILTMQSGGKDSLLLASMLREKTIPFSGFYCSSGQGYPKVLQQIGASQIRVIKRRIDSEALNLAKSDGALNGHVPVTYIMLSYALIDAILHNENTILAAIGQEGNEPHAYIGDLAINHQWSKTWQAEQLFGRYVAETVSPDIKIGSTLRGLSELRIAELFSNKAWAKYGNSFSSCNLANYTQSHDNSELKWCGQCPKCANSFVLFMPFVNPDELMRLFGGQNLLEKVELVDTFKGLFGVDDAIKPFECVAETNELRLAFHLAQSRYPGVYRLPFGVPEGKFDYKAVGTHQEWTEQYATT